MISKLFSLIPDPFRLYIEAAIAVGIGCVILYLGYIVHDRHALQAKAKAQSAQIEVLNEYVIKYAKDMEVLEAGKNEEINHIRKSSSKDRTPPALLDTINRLRPPKH
mgnify:CR=1 FL=1